MVGLSAPYVVAQPGIQVACKDPTRIRIYEEWENQADLDAHFAMPHMAAFVEGMGKLTVKSMNVVKFEQGETSPVG